MIHQLLKLILTIWLQTYLTLQPINKVVKTQTEASIAELLLASTPSDHFKISNHETTSHRYEHYSHEISDVEELSDIQKQFAQLFTDDGDTPDETLTDAERQTEEAQDIQDMLDFIDGTEKSDTLAIVTITSRD
jgi:hypothetical protein